MTTLRKFGAVIAGLTLCSFAGAAWSGERVTISVDHSRIITMSRTPATVVVGNPSIADVTVEGKNIFLHGHAQGSSNVIVLDEEGKQLADYEVSVLKASDNNVFVFKAGLSNTFDCVADCEATLHIGDDPAYFIEVVAKEQIAHNAIATGQKDGEGKQPAGQQQAPQ